MSDSERPIDLLLASLLAANPAESAELKEVLGEDVGPEESDRVRRAVAAMAKTAAAVDAPAELLRTAACVCAALLWVDGGDGGG